MEFEVTLSLEDAVNINDAAKKMGCSVESLLREAANSKRLLYVALKQHSAKLVAERSHPNPRKGSYSTKGVSLVALLPQYAESLAIFGNSEIAQYEAGFEPPYEWHYWMLDEPQTVDISKIFFPSSHLKCSHTQPETVGDDEADSQGETVLDERQDFRGVLPFPNGTAQSGLEDAILEFVGNGDEIDWAYWTSLNNITPYQAARLAYHIDPLKWKNDTHHTLEKIPANWVEPINKLEQWLADQSEKWDFNRLVPALKTYSGIIGKGKGFYIPFGMVDGEVGAGSQGYAGQQRPGKNGKRDEDAAVWYKTKKPEDVEKMTVIQIQAELKVRDKNRPDKLWSNGFSDWNRGQLIWPKKKPGRKSK